MKRTLQERFESQIMPIPECGCWIWMGPVNKKGYGKISADGACKSIHRVAWTIYHGPIPKGMHILHRCDTRPCGNPHHLFLGTTADNNADMMRKGRGVFAKGGKHGNAKLSDEQARTIKEDTRCQRIIAKEYGVCFSTVNHIKLGRQWRHI